MTSAATVQEQPAADASRDGADGGGWEIMDTLGLIAGALLVVIVIDIVSDGRLISRRLRGNRRQPEQVPEPVPNE